jgi:hypothetical protein
MITPGQSEILSHTVKNGRFVTLDEDVLAMASAGLLRDHGPQALAGGAHFLTTTFMGRTKLSEFRDSLPRPKPLTRAQRRYQDFLELDCGLRFIEWLKLKRAR